MTDKRRWAVVALYAAAMAWVESAVVYYLRTMIDRIDPHQLNPLPPFGGLEAAELVREAATLVMLLTVGLLAGRDWRSRLGYAAVAFGLWDIFYYVFLKVMCGWPSSVLDWDILFLLPLPWWGPVLAPVLIAALMVAWGTVVSQIDCSACGVGAGWKPWALSFLGVVLALYVFMADALHAVAGGEVALRNTLPARFDWPLFCLALLLMAAPLTTLCRQLWLRRAPAVQALGIDP